MKKYFSILCVLLLVCNVGFAQHVARTTLNTDAARYLTQLGSIVTVTTDFTDGLVFASQTPVINATGGAVVLGTAGNNTTPVDGTRWWTEVQIPYNVTLTGIAYLIGTVGGTDSVVVELFDSAGTKVASSLATDTEAADLVGTLANIQSVTFSSTFAAVAGKYYISLQFNGTTARLRTYTIPGSPFVAANATGTFKTSASITPGTTFTANQGPIASVY